MKKLIIFLTILAFILAAPNISLHSIASLVMAAYLTLSPTMSILTVINTIMGMVMGIPTDIPIGILTGIHFIMDLIHFSTAHSVLAHSSSIRSLVSTSGL